MSGGAGSELNPAPIMQLATSYWASRCLLTANRLGIFEALAKGAQSAHEVAATLRLAPRQTRLLLNACVGLGLLEQDGEEFRNHPSSQAFLVRGSRAFLGDAMRYAADMWDAWSGLDGSVVDGAPAIAAESYTGTDPEKTRNFVYGMHNRAFGVGQALVPLVNLTGRRRLLDVGGGPGTYSALLTRAYPELRSTVMDLPDVVAVAAEIVGSLEAADRVDMIAGDYKTTSFPGENDAILISGVFHRETEQTCRDLIARARAALVPNGLLIVSDVFTEEGGTGPAFATLFGVNMMLCSPDGGVHSDADVEAWMKAAGFRTVTRTAFPPPLPHRVVTATR
jgi:hypothetical protein